MNWRWWAPVGAPAARGRDESRPYRTRLAMLLLVVGMVALLLFGAEARAAWQDGPGDERHGDEDAGAIVVEVLADDAAWLELQEWVSQLRGLPLRRPVPRVALSPAAFRARQAELYRAYLDQADLERTRQLMVGLGVLEADADLPALLAELYTVLPIGAYDPLDKVIHLRRTVDPDGPLERMILAHELTHALQDQHYDLARLYQRPSDNADRDQAISTLLEGDGIVVQQMYVATTQPAEEAAQAVQQALFQQALQQVYVEIQQALTFDMELLPAPVFEQVYSPYLDGPGFIHTVVGTPALTTWGQYGPAVQRLFERPPQSSAELLHPEKYLRGWQPTRVELPDPTAALGGDWRLLRRQVVGEMDHRQLLTRGVSPAQAVAAAAGWAGNRAVVLADGGGQMATASATRWESAEDAAEWGAAYTAMVEARYPEARLVWAERGRLIWEAPEQAVLLEVLGAGSLVAQGPSVEVVETLAEGLGARRPGDLRGALARLASVEK